MAGDSNPGVGGKEAESGQQQPQEPPTRFLDAVVEAVVTEAEPEDGDREPEEARKRSRGGMSNLVAAAGVAVVALAAKKLLGRGRGRGSSEDGRTGKRLDDFGALVETFDLEPAPCPSVPQAPLLLTGTTFVVKDNINVKGSPTQYGCPAWSSAKAKANAKCVDLLLKGKTRDPRAPRTNDRSTDPSLSLSIRALTSPLSLAPPSPQPRDLQPEPRALARRGSTSWLSASRARTPTTGSRVPATP